MYKNILMAAVVLLAASCSNESEVTVVENQKSQTPVPVTVRVSGFAVSMEDLPGGATRAEQDVASYEGMKAITLAFYNGSTETYKTVQTRGALEEGETFGEFSLSLPVGSYTMAVVGQGLSTGESPLTLTSPTSATFGDNPARETFAATQEVTISNMDAVDISATLNRVVSKLQVISSDVRTTNAAKVRLSVSGGGKTFSPTTGLATVNTGISNTLTTTSAVGETSKSNIYILLATDDQTMDVTIETLDDSDNVLFSKTVTDVPFKRNRVTILTGAMYSNSSVSGAFQIETAWLTDYNLTF